MTSDADRGQVIASAAEVYDTFFVPALFAQWTDAVLDAADVADGHAVLDVGSGTGVLARAAKRRVGEHGRVAAVDPNAGMLDVARRTGSIDWKQGVAEALPFADDSFDRVVSQFALMFFTDPARALAEMARVTRPGGRVALAVWDRLDNNAGYARLADLLDRLFGPTAAQSLHSPFLMGDPAALARLASTRLVDVQVGADRGVARFESLEAWLHTEIRGWTLAGELDDEGFARLLDAAADTLADLVGEHGVAFDVSALIVSGAPTP